MSNEKTKRNYQKEYENERNKIKRYTIRVHKSVAEEFEKKLKSENKKYSEFMLQAIDKYIKKN